MREVIGSPVLLDDIESMYTRWLFAALLLGLVSGSFPATVALGQELPRQRSSAPSAAIAALTKAAEAGDVEAAYSLGQAYAFGRGVSQSMETARRWFEDAAERGHVGAMINLGVAHYHGMGGEIDLAAAYAWFELAAAFGSTIALYNLVEAEGRIGPEDRARGRDVVETTLPRILSTMTPEEIARAREAVAYMLADPTARRLIAALNTVRRRRDQLEFERSLRDPLPPLTPLPPQPGSPAD